MDTNDVSIPHIVNDDEGSYQHSLTLAKIEHHVLHPEVVNRLRIVNDQPALHHHHHHQHHPHHRVHRNHNHIATINPSPANMKIKFKSSQPISNPFTFESDHISTSKH